MKSWLDPLFSPRSIAVVGASPRDGAGAVVLGNLRKIGFTGRVHPVNPKYSEVQGLPCRASLADLPERVDSVAVLLGRRRLLPLLEQAAAHGAKAVWGFASGFAETGDEGRALQQRIRDFCRESGLLFCGPNCVGYANFIDRTAMYSAPLPREFRPGGIGVIAQSGAVLLALGNANRGVGFSRFISSGNEASLGLADYLNYLVDDEATSVIALFVETIRDPGAFAHACRRAAEKGKPVLALKVGRSEAACRAAATHTGAIAGSDRVLDAFFRRWNVARVDTLDELLESAVLFAGLGARPVSSRRVGMITVSGGEMGMLADVCSAHGLEFPALSEAGREKLAAVLPPYSPLANPLDAWGSGDLRQSYPASLAVLASEPGVETLIVSQDLPGNMAPLQVEQFTDVALAAVKVRGETGKPLLVVSNIAGGLDPSIRTILDQGGVPLLQGSGPGIGAVRRWLDWNIRRPELEALGAETDSSGAAAGISSGLPSAFPAALREALDACSGVAPHDVAVCVLAAFGLQIEGEMLTTSLDQAGKAAARIGYPVALKVISPDVTHKTEAGLVKLRLSDEASLCSAWRELENAWKRHHAGARCEGVLVQAMVDGDAVETIVGVHVDPFFGPAVLVGPGGILVELLGDAALELAPLSREQAAAMLGGLKAVKLLHGFRGKAPADVPALCDTLARLSRMACALRGRLVSLDLNPLMVLPQGRGVRIVDIVMQLSPQSENHPQ